METLATSSSRVCGINLMAVAFRIWKGSTARLVQPTNRRTERNVAIFVFRTFLTRASHDAPAVVAS